MRKNKEMSFCQIEKNEVYHIVKMAHLTPVAKNEHNNRGMQKRFLS